MKLIYTTIYSLLISLIMISCNDSYFDVKNNPYQNSNIIAFNIVSETKKPDSRELSEDKELQPVILTSDNDTLYLHRYVADVSETNSVSSRSVQVNDAADFKNAYMNGGFMVNALQSDGSQYFEFSLVTYDDLSESDNIWVTNPAKYWPDSRELHFNAYVPATANVIENISSDNSLISFDYKVPISSTSPRKDAEIQPDIMFAMTDFHHEPDNDNCDLVPLNFQHALSAIKFAVRDIANGEIVDISISGIAGSGHCVYNTENEFVWSNLSDAESTYMQTFNYETIDNYPDIPTVTVINKTMPEKTFMLIPQEIPDDAELIITVKFGGEPKILRGKLKTDDIPEWEPGKEYVYTISTSSENWTYVFNVNGSYRNDTEIYMPCPADDIYKEFTAGGGTKDPYFEVISYRYRTNNPTKIENLPWTASHGDGVQYYYNTIYQTFEDKDAILYLDRDMSPADRDQVAASSWITDTKGLYGPGGNEKDTHILEFYPANVTTDWDGDIAMYYKTPYAGNSEDSPWDLSTFGGQIARNTANCYVVDREGWYAIPLYYGNAIKNGQLNPEAWTTNLPRLADQKYDRYKASYYALNHFKDSHGNLIPDDGKISESYYNSAHLLWQDAFGVIDQVKLSQVNGEDMIVFHVNRVNIQQGNALIGLSEHTNSEWNKNEPKIVWSWHIWINEHWLNDKGISNAFTNDGFDTSIVERSKMQNQGDLKITVPQTPETILYYNIAPYNIGWCDAKNVRYLSRYNVMKFVQTMTGETRELPLIQDGKTIEYRYGNNVYYQFGRKDPFVGFVNHESRVKENYGKLDYETSPQLKTIAYSIQHPNQIVVGANINLGQIINDWNGESGWPQVGYTYSEYYNLWNNDAQDILKTNATVGKMEHERYYRYKKTIYDPSPAGYTIPPLGFFKILYKHEMDEYNFDDMYSSSWDDLNGYQSTWNPYLFRIYTSRDSQDKFFTLTSTGHRWYTEQTILGHLYKPGDNFNPQYVYLWTNMVTQYIDSRSGYSIAIGKEEAGINNGKYCVTATLSGRKSISRPVRCIRDEH